ncbi:MAG: EutN/CcmL family microcompartment protein [bacterium]|nr:EutN/CcmL family microcompartment protein [bacterium]
MILARVVGNVFCTVKHPALTGYRLLRVRPEGGGPELVAVDTVSAGPGDLVIVGNEGNAARQITGRADIPARHVIVGVVDSLYREA